MLWIGDPSGVRCVRGRRVLWIGDPSGVLCRRGAVGVLSIGDPSGVRCYSRNERQARPEVYNLLAPAAIEFDLERRD